MTTLGAPQGDAKRYVPCTKLAVPELEAAIAEINALIEAELVKLVPILGEEMTAIIAMKLDIDPAHLKPAMRAEGGEG